MININFITWDDYNIIKDGNFKELIWICFNYKYDFFAMWQKTLRNVPFSETKLNWLYWVIDSGIRKSLYISEYINIDILNIVINSFKDSCTEAAVLIPISLISFVVKELSEHNSMYKDKVLNLIKYIPIDYNNCILENYLLETLNWTFDDSKGIGDLLKNFINEMRELVKQGRIEEDDIFESVIDYVQELITIRDNLKPSD